MFSLALNELPIVLKCEANELFENNISRVLVLPTPLSSIVKNLLSNRKLDLFNVDFDYRIIYNIPFL